MLANHKGEIPLFILLLPFLAGLVFAFNFLNINFLNALIVVFICLGGLFIALNLFYKKLNIYKNRWLGGALITFILFLFGCIHIIKYTELNNDQHFAKTPAQFLVVKISNEPNLKNGILRFTANVEQSINGTKKLNTNGTLLISIKDSAANKLYYGDELLIPAKYNAINPPFNPAEFNYKKYLANQNIHYQAFLYSKQFVVLETDMGNPIISYSLRLRQHFVEKFKQNMRDTNAIAVASTLILGYKADLSNDILQAYSKTGTVHVLSVSGAHVAIFYILLNLALSFLNRFKYGRLLKAVIIILLIGYYALLTGFSPAVCRAAVMISMAVIGKTYSRYINTLNILAFSAFVLLIYDPFYITDVGFQLSYLAVFGLIIFQPVVYKWLVFKNKWADKLWALCSVSIAAQVITFPLSAYYFHQFPVYFLISNLFIIIPSAIIMYSGMAYLLLPQMPIISKWIAYILEQTILLMNKFLTIVEHIPYASIGKIWLNTSEYLLLYIIIICLFYFLYDKKLWLIKLSLVCILLLCISLSIKRVYKAATNSMAFLNLNKHKAIIFIHGNNAAVLTDINTTDKTWQYSIQPYLDSCQVNNIKLLSVDQDVTTPWMIKKDKLIQFMNKRIFVCDGGLMIDSLPSKINTDYIYITNNPHNEFNNIAANFDYRTIIADGSNSNQMIDEIKAAAINGKTDYRILKRNNSYVWLSNYKKQ
ncbi:ComEC/Rec2 family competence protein [Mucilaginibacter sp.]|uniref:ComEC/Rec2 family competence protein n=1 Tax=Mucilaginibacter sp. TaxID=1882438 RepID=UPI003D140F05